jgi:hypothetical protein
MVSPLKATWTRLLGAAAAAGLLALFFMTVHSFSTDVVGQTVPPLQQPCTPSFRDPKCPSGGSVTPPEGTTPPPLVNPCVDRFFLKCPTGTTSTDFLSSQLATDSGMLVSRVGVINDSGETATVKSTGDGSIILIALPAGSTVSARGADCQTSDEQPNLASCFTAPGQTVTITSDE